MGEDIARSAGFPGSGPYRHPADSDRFRLDPSGDNPADIIPDNGRQRLHPRQACMSILQTKRNRLPSHGILQSE